MLNPKISIIFLLFCYTAILPAQDEEDNPLFIDLEVEMISSEAFSQASIFYLEEMKKDRLGKLKALGLSEIHNCHEICETYLKEDFSDRKMLLPANFDQGILGYLFSPSSDRLIVYSSYDGPDFEDYYDYRAEIVVYTIGSGKGLDAIEHSHSHYTKTCSIEDLVWIDDKTIAIQIYEEHRPSDEGGVGFSYVKVKL